MKRSGRTSNTNIEKIGFSKHGMEYGKNLTEKVNRAFRVMRFTVDTGLKKTLFELHHGKKPGTKLPNIVEDGKTYGQKKLFEDTSRQCVFAITGGKFSGYYRLKKRFHGLADIPTIFRKKFDRRLDYSTSA